MVGKRCAFKEKGTLESQGKKKSCWKRSFSLGTPGGRLRTQKDAQKGKKGTQRHLKTSFVGQGNAENESESKRALPEPVGNDFERPGPQ